MKCGEMVRMPVRDLRCGDVVHRDGMFGTDHWIAEGSAHESSPERGRVHVPRLGCGTLAVFTTFDEVVTVCGVSAHCGSRLCGAPHREPLTRAVTGRCSCCGLDDVQVLPAGDGRYQCVNKARCMGRLDEISHAAEAARMLTGHDVKLTLFSDPAFGGVTLRWGVLRASDTDGITVDGYHDSAGVCGQYPDHRKDGNRVPWTAIRRIERDWHQA